MSSTIGVVGPRLIARDRLVTLKGAAQYTGLPPRAIKHAAEAGRLPVEYVTGSRRRWFRLSALDRLLVRQDVL